MIAQYGITGVRETQSGLSDAVVSGFLSPSKGGGGLVWGVGPAFLLPVGSSDFSTRKFGVGPTAVALTQANGWTIGGLVNQIWSVAGDEAGSDVSQMFLEPFVTCNWKSGAGLGATIEWTQDWQQDRSTVWLTPTLSGDTALGKQKVSWPSVPGSTLSRRTARRPRSVSGRRSSSCSPRERGNGQIKKPLSGLFLFQS